MSVVKQKGCFQKQAIEVEAENSLATLNKKILEIKKKIQLSEGQRKAYYEENDSVSKQNAEKINKLKKEIKTISDILEKAKTELGGEKQFRLIKYLHELGPIGNKNHDQLKQVLDLKVIDLHKQLDLIRYKRKRKKNELAKLEQDYQLLLSEKPTESKQKKGFLKTSKKKISQLENDIHRIAIQWMEAIHVRKKYSGIRYSLLCDSIKFESALTKVEQLIKQQNEEIKKLEDVNKSAMDMRDNTMSSLVQLESRISEASGIREKQLTNFKNKVDDRKAELERLERKIFPTSRPMLVQQDSVGSGELAVVEEENGSSISGINMDDIFQRLMKITGISDPEEVFGKFKGQKNTTEKLLYLKNNTEEEKKRLESDQNLMLAELEAHKFAQVKDKEENLEAMENLKTETDNMKDLQVNYETEEKKITEVLLDIKRTYFDCYFKLEDTDDFVLIEWSDDITNIKEISTLFITKFSAITDKLKELEVIKTEDFLSPKPDDSRRRSREISPLEKTPSEERVTLPTAYQELLAPRTKSRGAGTPSGNPSKPGVSDEEEEIPSRGFLKRQAQLIVDTKSRRKGYRIPQMGKK